MAEIASLYHEDRPWGKWEVLIDHSGYKVKRITVKPNQRLSYQYHHKRKEHWFVVQGTAQIVLDGKEIVIKKGEFVDIPLMAKHRVANISSEDLVFIEVQLGTYFGEDDIVRIEDDYGRN